MYYTVEFWLWVLGASLLGYVIGRVDRKAERAQRKAEEEAAKARAAELAKPPTPPREYSGLTFPFSLRAKLAIKEITGGTDRFRIKCHPDMGETEYVVWFLRYNKKIEVAGLRSVSAGIRDDDPEHPFWYFICSEDEFARLFGECEYVGAFATLVAMAGRFANMRDLYFPPPGAGSIRRLLDQP